MQRPHDEDGVHVRRRQEDAGEALQAPLRARPGDRHGRDEPSQDDPHARRGLHGLLNQLDHASSHHTQMSVQVLRILHRGLAARGADSWSALNLKKYNLIVG